MENAGYWLFTTNTLEMDWEKTDPASPYHLPRPAEEYWAAYKHANDEIAASLANPEHVSDLKVDLKGKIALPPVPANGAGLAASLALDSTLVPLHPQSSVVYEGDVTQARLAGIYLLRLTEGQTVTGTVTAKQIGNSPASVTWALIDAEGTEIASSLVLLGEAGTVEIEAPADGVYSLYINAGRNAFQVSLDAPYQVLREHLRGTLWIVSETPPLYFYVPHAADTFTVYIKIDAAAEGCNMRVLDPDGTVVVEAQNASGAYEIEVPEGHRGQAWSIEITKPTVGVFEDVNLHIEGCPPYFAYTPEQLLVPAPE